MRLAIADPPYPPFVGAGGVKNRASRWYGNGQRSHKDRPADYHPDAAEWDDPARKWESVIVFPPVGRRSNRGGVGMVSDVLIENTPGGFIGAKPAAWTRWVLDALSYDPEVDEVLDMFHGSGMVAAALSQGVLL